MHTQRVNERNTRIIITIIIIKIYIQKRNRTAATTNTKWHEIQQQQKLQTFFNPKLKNKEWSSLKSRDRDSFRPHLSWSRQIFFYFVYFCSVSFLIQFWVAIIVCYDEWKIVFWLIKCNKKMYTQMHISKFYFIHYDSSNIA